MSSPSSRAWIIIAIFFFFLLTGAHPEPTLEQMLSFSLEKTLYTVNEDNGSLEICVTGELTGDSAQLYFVDGSATMNVDYKPPAMVATLLFDPDASRGSGELASGSGITDTTSTPLPGSADLERRCAIVEIVDDSIAEPRESFTVILDSSSNIGTNVAEVHIIDNDVIVIGLEKTEYTGYEGEYVLVCVTVEEGGDMDSVPFDFVITSMPDTPLSAQPSFDYVISVREYPFLSGLLDTCQNITILDDELTEPVETFRMEVTHQDEQLDSVEISTGSAVVHIIDNDNVTISLAEAQYTVGEEDEEVTVCVQLEEGTLAGVTATVDYQILPGSASLADYLGPRVGSLSLGPEAVTGDTACLTISLVNDSIPESPETLTVSIQPSSEFVVVGTNGSATVTIIDDDGVLAAVGMEAGEYMFSEGDGVIVVCAVLEDGDLGSISEIPFSVEDDTASVNIDYLLPQKLVFRFPLMSPVGQPACVEFTLVNDNIVEDMETFEIRLTPLPGVTVGTNGFASVTIVDDDFTAAEVTDVVSADPLFKVHIRLSSDSPLNPPLALCYQVHGDGNTYYNILSTSHASLNGLWTAETGTLNVLTELSVQTISRTGECYRIIVELEECTVSINGESFTSNSLHLLNSSEGGVFVSRDDDRVVVIRVPDGGSGEGLRVVVECESRRVFDGEVETPMLLLRITRKLSLSGVAHGLLGQFYHRSIEIEPHSDSDPDTDYYTVTVPEREGEPERQFLGRLYHLDWNHKQSPCLYVGDSQGGPVISGLYRDYAVNNRFSEEGYRFGVFNSDNCVI